MQLTAQDFAPTNQPTARPRRAVRCRPGHGLAAYDGSNPHMHGLGFLKKIKKAAKKAAKKVVSAPLKIASAIAKPAVSVAVAPAMMLTKPVVKTVGSVIAKPKPLLPAVGAGAAAGGATVYAGGGGGLVDSPAGALWDTFYSRVAPPSVAPPVYVPPPVYQAPAAPVVQEVFAPAAPVATAENTGGGSILPGVDNKYLMMGGAALLALVALKR